MSRRTRGEWWSFGRRHQTSQLRTPQPQRRAVSSYRAHGQLGINSYARRLRVEPLEDRRLLSITVNSLFDELDGSIVDNDISLRDAIVAAPAGETIEFNQTLFLYGPKVLPLTLGELVINKNLTIVGPGASLLTLDASFSDATPFDKLGDGSRVFRIDDGTPTLRTVSISGLTLTGGDTSGSGGAIFAVENLTLSDSVITGNASSSGPIGGGGGIYSLALPRNATSLKVLNSWISDNHALGFEGGGIRKRGGYLLVENSTITGNTANDGGGGVSAAESNVQVVIKDSYITSNVSRGAFNIYDGGGGLFFYHATATITNSRVSNNSATYGAGGGIYAYASRVTTLGCTISGNIAALRGGGVHVANGELSLQDSFITGNTGRNGGGGIYSHSGSVAMNNASVEQNVATYGLGGGILSRYGALNLVGASVRYNLARDGGGGIFRNGPVTISASTISGNWTEFGRGGGLALYGSYPSGYSLNVSNSTIANNHAEHGGGIYKWRGNLTLTSSSISGNVARTGDGGAIYNAYASLNLEGSSLELNSAGRYGGGVFSRAATITVDRTILRHNAARLGGAIWSDGTLNVRQSLISHNSATSGGGIYQINGAMNVLGTTLTGNSAHASSGGAIASRNAAVSLLSSTISGNHSSGSGGGLYLLAVNGAPLEVRYSTLALNNAGTFGGGIFSVGSTLELSHSIVATNTAPFAPDLAGLFGASIEAQFSLIGINTGSPLAEAPVGAPDTNGNLIGGPLGGAIDPLLAALSGNGDPILFNGERLAMHSLLAGSPALDAGDPHAVAGTGGLPEFDQRGGPYWTRIVDGDNDGTARIDIGALEQRTLNLIVDTLADENDGNLSPGDVSLREALALSNGNVGEFDSIHFHPDLAGGTILLTLGELAIVDPVDIVGLGADLLTVDASGNDPTPNEHLNDGSRVFRIDFISDVWISGLTITGGDTYSGGGIYTAAPLYLNGVAVTGNDGESGGGIAVESAARLTLVNSRISGNRAWNGGGISARYSYLSITDSAIYSNTADARGGGLYLRNGLTLIGNSTFLNNSAGFSGGGIQSLYGPLLMTTSTISSNSAPTGGGVSAWGGTVSVESSSVVGNSASQAGGGLEVANVSNFTLTGSTISGNTAGVGGGLRFAYTSYQSIFQSTINNNRASDNGGGIFHSGGRLVIGRSTLSGNTAIDGGGVYSRYGELHVSESTVRDNSAAGAGGGLYARAGQLSIDRSTLSNNSAAKGGGFSVSGVNLAITSATIVGNSAQGNGGGGYLFTPGGEFMSIRHSTITSNSAGTFGGNLASVGGQLYLDHSIVARGTATFSPDVAVLFGTLDAHYSLIGHNAGSGLAATPAGPDANGNRIGPIVSNSAWVVYVELAGMGDFETAGTAPDRFWFEYSVDGGVFQPLATIVPNEAANQTYFMASGMSVFRDDPLEVDGVLLSNYFLGFNFIIPVTGAEVKIRFRATNDGPTEAFAWRNMSIYRQSDGALVGRAVQYFAADDHYAAFTTDPDDNVPGDMFGIRSRGNPGPSGLPFDIADDSIFTFPGDNQGIVPEFDDGRFFGVVDTVNGVGSNMNEATWTFNNLLLPLDPLLGPLQDNGGPTLTMVPLEGSPVLEAGDATDANVPLTDQRGAPYERVVGTIDIGAVESQPHPTVALAGDYNGDGRVDTGDYSVWRDSLYCVVGPFTCADGDGNGWVDDADYLIWKANFGATAAAGSASLAVSTLTSEVQVVALRAIETSNASIASIEESARPPVAGTTAALETAAIDFRLIECKAASPARFGPGPRQTGTRVAHLVSDQALGAWFSARAERVARARLDDGPPKACRDGSADSSSEGAPLDGATSADAIDAVFDLLAAS